MRSIERHGPACGSHDSVFDASVRTLAQRLASEIAEFSYTETGTELLALLLEDRLIKREYPEYNVRQREYREYRYLCLTEGEFPNLRVVRNLDEAPAGDLFGPFRDLYFATEVKQISEDLLHLRACSDAQPSRRSPRYDLGRCPGPCRGKVSKDEYAAIVKSLAAKHDAILVDTQVGFDKMLESMHPMAIAWDRIHPNTSGHAALAQCFLKAIGFEL